MSVTEIKAHIHQLVDRADDKRLLQTVEQLLADQLESDILDELTPEQLARLDESIEQHRQGNVISHEVMKQRYGQWLKK